MSTQFKSLMREVMRLAWQMVKNIKLKAAMKERIVRFYFQKVDGSLREAYGTLKESLLPENKGTDNRKKSDTVQVYFDTEKSEYRCYKVANLVRIG